MVIRYCQTCDTEQVVTEDNTLQRCKKCKSLSFHKDPRPHKWAKGWDPTAKDVEFLRVQGIEEN